MKKIILLTSALALVACKPKAKTPEAGPVASAVDISSAAMQYTTIAPKNTTVKWRGSKLTGEHTGTIEVKSARLGLDKDGKLIGGSITIDMTSIKNEDVKDPKDNAKLVGHLKSEDFFNVAVHPTAKFEVTAVAGDQVTGNLTIKGKSEPITITAKVSGTGDSASASTNFKFDRSKFDVRYGSKSFFPNIGDKIIHNDIELTVNLEMVK